ncbi:MAG: type I-B CRISPR-associated protein Cas7/Csh2 [Thermotogota bacterium]|nr:type I-B CRISPR-associated protein Cas7/Csh2 [Thermotogota bacterium]
MFKKRRQYIFVYAVKDANPNGDPLNDNHPRYDEETEQIQVSDVRIKRTVRDEWVRIGETVFVDGEPKTMANRYKELKKMLNTVNGKDTMAKCIDTRLFGVTFSHGNKETFSWTGPVQFQWGRSLNRQKVQMIQGTAAFSTKDGNEQRSFRSEYIVPYSIITTTAIANETASETTGATDDDLNTLKEALWEGTRNLITRSKMEHRPMMLMEITYKEDARTHLCAPEEYLKLTTSQGLPMDEEEQLKIRSANDFGIDISDLQAKLTSMKAVIEDISIQTDDRLTLIDHSPAQQG